MFRELQRLSRMFLTRRLNTRHSPVGLCFLNNCVVWVGIFGQGDSMLSNHATGWCIVLCYRNLSLNSFVLQTPLGCITKYHVLVAHNYCIRQQLSIATRQCWIHGTGIVLPWSNVEDGCDIPDV